MVTAKLYIEGGGDKRSHRAKALSFVFARDGRLSSIVLDSATCLRRSHLSTRQGVAEQVAYAVLTDMGTFMVANVPGWKSEDAP